MIRDTNVIGQTDLLSEKELTIRGITDQSVLLKIIPNKETPETFLIENCAKSELYDEGADKLWLITKSLKRDGVKEVMSFVILAIQTKTR